MSRWFVSRTRFLFAHPGLLALLFCCFFVGILYFAHDCDPMYFVIIGDRFALGDPLGDIGYDGQFAYYIAIDPVGAPALIDAPAYRYQRLLYPMVARMLALGRPEWVPWALVFINIVSISLSTELVGRVLDSAGLNPVQALILPLWLGQLFSLRADLHEPLCFLLVIAALWWYNQGSLWLSALAMAAAVLTKEAAILFLFSIVWVLLLRRRWLSAWRYALVVLLPYVVMQLGLYLWLGQTGFDAQGASLECIPYYGLSFVDPLESQIFLIFFIAIPVTLLLIMAGWQIQRTLYSESAWALMLNCLFIIFLPRWSFVDVLAVFRLSTGVVVAFLFLCAEHRLRWLLLTLHIIWLLPTGLAVFSLGFL